MKSKVQLTKLIGRSLAIGLVACVANCSGGSEEQKVYEKVNELFLKTDARDWPAVKAVFAGKVNFDMSSLTGDAPVELTPDEIAGAWEKGLAPLEAVHHQTGNYVIRVDGSRATAFCYGTASHYLPTKSGNNVRKFVGSYDFELARENGQWKITSFKFNFKYMDGNPDLEKEAI
jgi:hypothetical protein